MAIGSDILQAIILQVLKKMRKRAFISDARVILFRMFDIEENSSKDA